MSTYPPAPTTSDLVKIRPVQGGVPSPITRYVPLGDLPGGGAGVSTVTDGVHTVTNASTIDFTAGATVTNLGGGVAGVSISGGGTTSTSLTLYDTHGNTLTNVGTVAVAGSGTVGGSGTIGTISGFGGGGGGYVFADGLGISNDTITNPGTVTINNTGTIIQPAPGSGQGIGIKLQSSPPGTGGTQTGKLEFYVPTWTYAGTNQAYQAGIYFYAYEVRGSNPGANLRGGAIQMFGGGAYILGGVARGLPANFSVNGGYAVTGTYASGASMSFAAGGAVAASYQKGGSLYFTAGGVDNSGTNKGGSIQIASGTGAVNGVILLNNQGTIGTDPHVLNADWVSSVAGVGFVVMRSQG